MAHFGKWRENEKRVYLFYAARFCAVVFQNYNLKPNIFVLAFLPITSSKMSFMQKHFC